MHPHTAKIVSKPRLHKCACCWIERLAATAQRMDPRLDSGRNRGRSTRFLLGLQLALFLCRIPPYFLSAIRARLASHAAVALALNKFRTRTGAGTKSHVRLSHPHDLAGHPIRLLLVLVIRRSNAQFGLSNGMKSRCGSYGIDKASA